MNLKEIRDQVGEELQHFPDVKAARERVNKVINRVYKRLMTDHRWRFRQREYRLRLFDEVVVDVAAGTFAALNAQTLTVPLPTGWLLSDIEQLPGHECVVTTDAGGSYGTPPLDAPDHIYTIERAEQASGGTIHITLDPRFTSWFPAANPPGLSVVIRFRRYLLPRDCADVYRVMSRDDDQGPLTAMSVATEHDIMLNDDVPGDPRFYLAGDNLAQRAVSNSSPRLANLNWRQMENRAPVARPVLADDGAGTMSAGTYEYKYVWSHSGRISAPSPIGTITLPALRSVSVSAFEIITAPANIGRERLFFRRKDEGRWELVTTLSLATTTSFRDDQKLLPVGGNPLNDTRYNELSFPGKYKYVRFWPVPATDKTVNVHYLARVPALEHETDTPAFDENYHDYLVHQSVVNIAPRHEGTTLAKTSKALAEEALDMLKGRYLDDSAQTWQRRPMGVHRGGHFIQPAVVFDNS